MSFYSPGNRIDKPIPTEDCHFDLDKNLIKPQNQILMVEMQVLASNVRDTSFSFVKPPLRLITFVFFTKLSLATYSHA